LLYVWVAAAMAKSLLLLQATGVAALTQTLSSKERRLSKQVASTAEIDCGMQSLFVKHVERIVLGK